MSVAQANMLVQGAPGTAVKIDVVHRGKTEPQEISLTRVQMGTENIVADKVGDDIGYIRMPALETADVTQLHDKLSNSINRASIR
jgi:C-terminal processing protease CtpA/Prc